MQQNRDVHVYSVTHVVTKLLRSLYITRIHHRCQHTRVRTETHGTVCQCLCLCKQRNWSSTLKFSFIMLYYTNDKNSGIDFLKWSCIPSVWRNGIGWTELNVFLSIFFYFRFNEVDINFQQVIDYPTYISMFMKRGGCQEFHM